MSGSPVRQSIPDEGELKILKEVMKLSELDYLKDQGGLDLSKLKKKNNRNTEDDIDQLFNSTKPPKNKPLNRGASDFNAFPQNQKTSPRYKNEDTNGLLAPVQLGPKKLMPKQYM
jgi:hypothetical protein